MVKKRIIHKKKKLYKKTTIKFPKLSINLSILKTKNSVLVLTILLLFFIGLLFYQIPLLKINTENVFIAMQKNSVFKSPGNPGYLINIIISILILASFVMLIEKSIKLYKVAKQR